MLRSNAVTAGITLALTLVAAPAIAFAAAGGAGAPEPAPAPAAPASVYAQVKAAAAAASDPSPQYIEQTKKDLGLTTQQAELRIANELAAGQLEPLLRGRLGSAYAGTWVTGPLASLVVATTDAAQSSVIREAGAEPKVVQHSLATLDAAKVSLDRALSNNAEIATSWGADVQTNRVVVRTPNPAKAKAKIKAAGIDASLVDVVKSSERPALYADVRGGDAYYIGSSSRCSVGFSVTKAGSQGGFVTAGHCGSTGASTTGVNRQAQGTFRGSSFPGNDYAWVEVNSQWVPRGIVNAYNAGIVTINGSTVAQPQTRICRSGSTTQNHCGSVQQLNTSVTYPQGTVSGVTRTNVCAEPGDSGGSFYSGDQAQGMTSGGSGNCSSGGTTYFQPVNEALQVYGLQLADSDGPGPTGSPTTSPTGGPTDPPGGTWKTYTSYSAGATVTYGGTTYRCLQSHTSLPGWEPPNVPALWSAS
ncbi:serine protease [Spongiactinospora gelatinilytica]|uniref:Serine protease n=1 Tax=Spongiactinospora gelatinilytica TaxID=2666298 RepID=A0A2W2F4Q7_9ACTN|nr:carbohydrate-binding protein [Spongiactinospora gelatinilytica]PZG30952.1 serine protease [Spongiactinospora gelatinilytica]